jgi:hypothetical protein
MLDRQKIIMDNDTKLNSELINLKNHKIDDEVNKYKK